jgi:hypothetical protein
MTHDGRLKRWLAYAGGLLCLGVIALMVRNALLEHDGLSMALIVGFGALYGFGGWRVSKSWPVVAVEAMLSAGVSIELLDIYRQNGPHSLLIDMGVVASLLAIFSILVWAAGACLRRANRQDRTRPLSL